MKGKTEIKKQQKWKTFSIAVKETAFEQIKDYYAEQSQTSNLSFSRFIGVLIIEEIEKRKNITSIT